MAVQPSPDKQREIELLTSGEEHYGKIVWKLAWPAVALNLLQTANSMLGVFFVGTLNRASLTAYGQTASIQFLLFSLGMSFSIAATAIVSRAYGARDEEGFKNANRRVLGFTLAFGFIVWVASFAIIPAFVSILAPHGDQEVANLMHQYVTIFAISLPAIYLIQALAGSLRGIGDTISPMVLSGGQILLNIALNYLLIFPTRRVEFAGNEFTMWGAGMGLAGAAWAITVSALVAVLAYLAWSTRTPLGNVWKIRLPDAEWTRRLGRLAAPAAGMSIVRVLSFTILGVVIANLAGEQADLAGAAIRTGFTIEALAFMPAFGFQVAASALVGQSLGMEKPGRAERLGWLSGHYAAVVGGIIGFALVFTAFPIAHAFLPEQPEVADIAAWYIIIVCATEILFSYSMVLSGALQGAGDVNATFVMAVVCLWGIRVPLAAVLALPQFFNLGAIGVWIAMSASQSVNGLYAMWLWKKGRWKFKKV